MAESENYWNESDAQQHARLNFDDNDENVGSSMCGVSLGGTTKLFHELRKDSVDDDHSFLVADVKAKVPLSKLISQKALNKMLEVDSEIDTSIIHSSNTPLQEEVRILRRKVADRWVVPDVSDTILRMLLGKPFSLQLYKSLEQKKMLLEAAISMGDGDAILAVVVFLLKTLKKSIFNQLLMNHPIAASHYINHLSTRMQIQELTDLLTMLGRTWEASIRQFETACRNPQRQLPRLTNCLQNHFYDNSSDRQHVEKFIKLLEWQKMAKLPNEIPSGINGTQSLSVVDCLCYTIENHWSEPAGSTLAPITLVQQHGVNDKQFQWAVLLVKGKMKQWHDIDNCLITKKWLGGRKLKALLPMERIVLQLHSFEAPSNVLADYLSLIDDLDERLKIARTVTCHMVMIEIYALQRDRLALLNCRAFLEPQSEECLYAEAKLNSSAIKWKN